MVFLAVAPVSFKKDLESQEATEGDKATLSCETSSPDGKVTWWKGSSLLTHGEKYTMEQRATTHTLVIHKLNVEDSGEYTCDTGDKKSTATVTVKGKRVHLHLIYVSCLLLSQYFPKSILHFSVQISSTGLYFLLFLLDYTVVSLIFFSWQLNSNSDFKKWSYLTCDYLMLANKIFCLFFLPCFKENPSLL